MMFQYTTSLIALVAVIYWYRYKPHPDQVFNIQLNSSYDYIIGASTSVWTFWSIILFNIQILYSRAILLIEISSLVFTQRDFFPWYCLSDLGERFNIKTYHSVGTVEKHTILSEQLKNIPHYRNSWKTYHTVGTVEKHTTLSEQLKNIPLSKQLKNIPYCRNSW
jgi:hypothetical protein